MSASDVFLHEVPARHALLLADLDRWVAQGWLRVLDRSFAAFLAQKAPDADPLLILSAALASHQLGRGHACLDLHAALLDAGQALSLPPENARALDDGEPTKHPSDLLKDVSQASWALALEHPTLVGHGPGATPLVLIGRRLYLRRYWQYEQSVRQAIAQRVALPTQAAAPESQAALADALNALFPRHEGAAIDWQKIACALAARQGFSIVTGGPGTGKTTTVVKLLAMLQYLALSGGSGQGGVIARRLRIRLAAPTGKAAARLNESIAGAVERLPLAQLPHADAVRAAIPTDVTTVHRLLGSRPDTRRFVHDERRPLALDVLVLDEASMLDLEIMAAVFAALPAQAILILLGDKDQLASVEAGSVLGDLCQRADAGHYRPDTAAWLLATTGETLPAALCDAQGQALDQAVVKLRVSHRFSADSGIGLLAEAVNAGNGPAVKQAFRARHADLSRQWLTDDAAVRRLVVDGAPEGFAQQGHLAPPVGYRHYLTVLRECKPPLDAPQADVDAWARQVLQAYGQFQVLCALRSGPQGVEGLNLRIAQLLRHEGLLDVDHGGWYLGRPVLVTRNDHSLGLMNGDVGVTLALPTQVPGEAQPRWIWRVAFASGDGHGGIRWVLPSRLRAVDTVFAMTVHKSQGSEFTHAALILPQHLSPVLTRELVYTGITRARHWFTLAASDDVMQAAVQRRVDRVGGLAAEL
jgi:exodeoxyribonuclease V alpha subunit